MKTIMQPKRQPNAILSDLIATATEHDRRGDTARRNQTIRQILGDEMGLRPGQAEQALRGAGLRK